MAFITWLQAHWALIFAVLFGVSETLALIPAVKSNSVFQLVWSVLQKLKPQDPKPAA
jgi:hypothetical protein